MGIPRNKSAVSVIQKFPKNFFKELCCPFRDNAGKLTTLAAESTSSVEHDLLRQQGPQSTLRNALKFTSRLYNADNGEIPEVWNRFERKQDYRKGAFFNLATRNAIVPSSHSGRKNHSYWLTSTSCRGMKNLAVDDGVEDIDAEANKPQVDILSLWKELQSKKKSSKPPKISSREKAKLKSIFDSFEIRGWAADQALAIYINSKVFPTAAQSFRKFLMSTMTAELKDSLISMSKNKIAAEEFLFPLFSEFCFTYFPAEIKSYRELVDSADMTKPHTWYPFARAMKRKIIYHRGPTNSGKTFSALKSFREAKSGIYCGPLRLLAMEVYDTVNLDGIYCNLITGQEKKIMPFAEHVSCTVEMANLNRSFEVAVIDEIQMIADEYRGWAWTRALLGLKADEIHVCGDASACHLIQGLLAHTNDVLVDFEYERFKPLTVDKASLRGDIANIRSGDCIVAFSRREIFTVKRMIEAQTSHQCCVIYGSLPPETRRQQAKLFNDAGNSYDVLVASDAVGMGLNLNIGRMVFTTLHKFNGEEKDLVPSSLIKQIAGRAGRRNSSFAEGVVTTFAPSDIPLLVDGLSRPIADAKSAGLFPLFEQMELFASQVPESTFSDLLSKFIETSRLDGHYFLCKTDNLRKIATALEKIPGLSLEDRFKFSFAPANIRDPTSMMYLLKFAKSFAEGSPVPLGLPSPQTNKVDDKTLFVLESKHQVASLYMWLAQQFSVRMFPHLSEAEKVGAEIAKKLARGLMQVGGSEGGADAASKGSEAKQGGVIKMVASVPSRKMSMKEVVREFERIRLSRENGVAPAF